MKETFRVCPVCEKKFPCHFGKRYCSDECAIIAWRVLKASGNGFYATLRRNEYLGLIQYVKKNKLKKILEKYKPQIKDNKKA